MGFSRREDWSGCPGFLPGDLPDPGIEPESPAGCRPPPPKRNVFELCSFSSQSLQIFHLKRNNLKRRELVSLGRRSPARPPNAELGDERALQREPPRPGAVGASASASAEKDGLPTQGRRFGTSLHPGQASCVLTHRSETAPN